MKLTEKGHYVYVTTTSTGKQLDAEIQKARQLTKVYDGQIELLQPQLSWLERTPSPEWIQKNYEQHFNFLSKLDVQGVIGILPGTAKTAILLKEKLKCKVILLATCKLKSSNVIECAIAADEVWSVGPDIYTHYEHIFPKGRLVRHEEVMLLPDRDIAIYSEPHIRGKKV